MNPQDLFAAIGQVDETVLTEPPALRRPSWQRILIAAVIATLALGACAAAVTGIVGAIQSAQLRHGSTIDVRSEPPEEGMTLQLMSVLDEYSVVIDFALEEDLPTAIETAYLPTAVPEDWWCEHYYAEPNSAVYGDWYVGAYATPGESVQSIFYIQTLLTQHDAQNKEVHRLSVTEDGSLESQTLQIGGRDVLEVTRLENGRSYKDTTTGQTITLPGWAERHYYWSDGAYLFYLNVPNTVTHADAAAFIESLQPGQMPALSADAYWQMDQQAMTEQGWEEYLNKQK